MIMDVLAAQTKTSPSILIDPNFGPMVWNRIFLLIWKYYSLVKTLSSETKNII